jgi:cell wall-associated NlpC family hydrolase
VNAIHDAGFRPSVNSHWTSAYVGKPWSSGERGPRSFDCWGLVHNVYLTQLGIDLPQYAGLKDVGSDEVKRLLGCAAESGTWIELDRPQDLCVVTMGQAQVDHVGIFVAVDGGRVLHCGRRLGVVCSPLAEVRSKFSKVYFYVLG